ncbi:MAG: ferredoxin [Desulfuromusa sp.]|nr:ferredoxin [Desulfuromusa sp.]
MPRIPTLDGAACIGCETCTRICPKVFHMISEHQAAILNPTGDTEEKIEEAMDNCPVACINWED